jgi:hypothetical protein
VIEATEEAETAWVEEIVRLASAAGDPVTSSFEECTPGYYNREGRGPRRGHEQPTLRAGHQRLQCVARRREQGDLEGMKIE